MNATEVNEAKKAGLQKREAMLKGENIKSREHVADLMTTQKRIFDQLQNSIQGLQDDIAGRQLELDQIVSLKNR